MTPSQEAREYPPLPHAVAHVQLGDDSEDVFTAEQMHSYVDADRKARQQEALDALREADRIFCWLERRTIYQDCDIKQVHAKVRAAIAKGEQRG